jgi:hypothetical protein
MLDDALDAARADRRAGLTKPLGDNVRGSLGVEEAMPDRLADDFVGAAVVALGPSLEVDQGGGAVFGEGVAELEVALLAVAEHPGGLNGPQPKALAGDEHGEFTGDFIVGRDGQRAVRTDQLALLNVELEHGRTPGRRDGRNILGGRIATAGHQVQEKMAGKNEG